MSHKRLLNAIDTNQGHAFLVHYFEIIQSGVDLPIPSGLEKARIQKGWAKICDDVIQCKPSDDFLMAVSDQWYRIIKKQGGNITPDFVPAVLKLLGQTPDPNRATRSPKPESNAPATKSSIVDRPTKRVYPKRSKPSQYQPDREPLAENDVDASISDSYRETETDVIVPSEAACIKFKKQLETAYHARLIPDFLTAYFQLAVADYHTVPALSGEDAGLFYSQWRSAMLICLDVPADDRFLKQLHTTWLRLYFKARCIPTTKQHYVQWITRLASDDIKTQAQSQVVSTNKPWSHWFKTKLQVFMDLIT